MTVRTTRWAPDTCPCVIDLAWEDTLDPTQRTHTYAGAAFRCPDHQNVQGPPHLDQIVSENGRKNRVHGALLAGIPALTQTVTDPGTGQTSVVLKNGVSVSWSFDAARHLTITVTGATQAQRNQLQSLADAALGAGAVTIA